MRLSVFHTVSNLAHLKIWNIVCPSGNLERFLNPIVIPLFNSSNKIKLTRPRDRKGKKNAPQTYTRLWTVLSSMYDESRDFVIECPLYDDIRNELIFSNPNIPPSDKFMALFNSENKTLLYNLGLYISRALQYRKDSLTEVMWSISWDRLLWMIFYFI